VNFRNKMIFLRWGVVSPTPNPQAGGPPIVGCPRLFIQYICRYPPYLLIFWHVKQNCFWMCKIGQEEKSIFKSRCIDARAGGGGVASHVLPLVFWKIKINNKFCEESIAYFPLIRHRPHRNKIRGNTQTARWFHKLPSKI
jgi:hypothetical protein